MPILWRYALQSYTRVFLLSLSTFITVLIVTRFKEIARFTALTGKISQTALFTFYQIPSILPIAIPISALIAAFLFFQRFSRESELTALRASGLSFRTILTPLLLTSLLFAFFNFFVCASLTPFCRRESKVLLYNETSQNPLLLLQRQQLIKMKDTYLSMKKKDEETAKDLLLVFNKEGLNLFSAHKLKIVGDELHGSNLALITYRDQLMIENQSSMSTSAPLLSAALKKNRSHLDIHALDFKWLLIKGQAAFVEILRRISLSLSVFSFTLIGSVFGIEVGRNPKRKRLILALLLILAILMSYLLGKELKNFPLLAIVAFLFPHPLSWICSLLQLRRISRGTA